MFDFLKKKKKTDQNNMADQIALGMNVDNLARHSEAGQEFIKAYTGFDGSTGQEFQKSLSGIASGEYNLPGQRGYAAEVRDVSKRNAEEILGGTNIRYSRVDDLPGHAVNETAFDIMAVSPDGREITSLGAQMKFNQGNPADVADTLVGKNFRGKYPHAQYSVPQDRYDAIKSALADKEATIEKQLERTRQNGNTELVNTLEERLDYIKRAKKNLVSSKVTLKEAELAVANPYGTTVRDIAELGHEAGVNYAKSAAVIRGSMVFARCADKVMRGEMTSSEAATEITVETSKSAGLAYLTGQANTALASIMRNSSKEVLRELGRSSAPAQIIAFTTSVFSIMNDRMEGRITDEECFNNIAKSGIGVAGTFKAGAVVGAVAGPVGAIVASMVAGVVINATYDYAFQILSAPGIARQERIEIEQQCEMLHRELEMYREKFRSTYIANTNQLMQLFGTSLRTMAIALRMNDADSFIGGANAITRALGGTTQFETVDDFAVFLDSDDAFNL